MGSYQDLMSGFARVASLRGVKLRKGKAGQKKCRKCNSDLSENDSLFSFLNNGIITTIPGQYCHKCHAVYYDIETIKGTDYAGMIRNPWISLPTDSNSSPQIDGLKLTCARKQDVANKKSLKKLGIHAGMLKNTPGKKEKAKVSKELNIDKQDLKKAQQSVEDEFECCGDLFVHKGLIKCYRDHHDVIPITATAKAFWEGRDTVEINVNYCPRCRIMFIGYEEYEHYYKMRKLPVIHFRMVNSDGSFSYNDLSDESPLRMMGYRVDQKVDLSDYERQSVLSRIIETKILRKQDVINYLESFIRRNGQKAGNAIAKEKWQDDLHYVMELGMENQLKGMVTGVRQYGENKKKSYVPWWKE